MDLQRGREVFGPLTDDARRLIEAIVMTDVDDAAARRAQSLIRDAVDVLHGQRLPEPSFGVRHTDDGSAVAWGNVAIGLRNPIAPPLSINRDQDSAECDFELGAPYEGPPGHVHGGVCALILDHVLAATAHEQGRPAVTGTLTVRYRRPTRLGQLHARAHLQRQEGVKLFIVGHIADDEGPTVEAEGIFIRREGVTGDA